MLPGRCLIVRCRKTQNTSTSPGTFVSQVLYRLFVGPGEHRDYTISEAGAQNEKGLYSKPSSALFAQKQPSQRGGLLSLKPLIPYALRPSTEAWVVPRALAWECP